MDPNATYGILRFHVTQLIEQLQEIEDGERYMTSSEMLDTADTVAEAFDALDGWLKQGGFYPEAWAKGRRK